MNSVGKFVIACLLVASGVVWAQTPEDSGPTPAAQVQSPDETPPGQNGPTPQYTRVDQPESLNFLGEAAENSTLRLGFMTGYLYDAAYSNVPARNQFLIGPRVGLNTIRSRLSVNFTYSGMLTLVTGKTQQDYYGQNAGIDILWQFAPHWQAHAADHYVYTSNPFEGYFAHEGQPLPDNPNPTFYSPTARRSQNTATLDLSDRMTAVDTLTLTGSTFFRRYSNAVSGTTTNTNNFYNVLSYSGGANYLHQFTPKLGLGGGYTFTSLDFTGGLQRSGINQMQLIVKYQLSPSISISGFAGPEHVSAKNTFEFFGFRFVVHQSSWNPSVGFNLGWKDTRNSVILSYVRQTTDGGGLLATSNTNVAKLAYMRQLTSRWTGSLASEYTNYKSFAASQTQSSPNRGYHFWNAQALADRKLRRSMHVDLRYAYIHSNYENIGAIGSRVNNYHSVWATLNYNWTHPLGR